MKCQACQHENPERGRFCLECGAGFTTRCLRCHAELPPNAKFCLECGAAQVRKNFELAAIPATRNVADYTPSHLAERIRAEQAALEARGAADGERKTITALFADLKGSTALIEGLDPEAVRALIDPALQLMMDAVHQYDGYVAQALGDGIFALFGAPLAHEDHPQRAVYAALRMQETMGRYADTLRSKGYPPLQMRVGLNTGEVVVRSIRKDDLHTDYVPVGHSINLAARMEQLANPGTIVVSAYTHRLTDGYFAFKDLGPTEIKGVEAPLNIYEVLSVGSLRTRLQVSARRGLTRFVGRQSELEQLNKALEQAKAGHGQIVGVMGEPGLGKSRLFYEFKLLSVAGCLVLEAYSVSHGKATAYLPVIELLKTYFDIQAQDDERKRREKVTGKVLNLDRSLEDTLPYLFALLGIEAQPSPLQQMDAQIRRRRTFEALKKLFLRESLNQPLVLIFEDLHWIDGETQGFLDALSERVAGAKLLLLTNYRPEYRHEWGQKTYYTQLRLAPLGQAEAAELLTFLLGGDARLAPVKSLILATTQGTPFFMEEVVQTLVEEGALSGARGDYRLEQSLNALHISPTVQGVLAARIDRLNLDEKNLLQQLAVIGRQFSLGLVRKVVAEPEADLQRLLASLQGKEFLYEQPAFPDTEYIFKHALTQEVAYGTVLQERRKALHERTAAALETLYAANLEECFGELAHHYTRANNKEKAVRYLHLAGEQGIEHAAYAEAENALTSALTLLHALPDSSTRARQELAIQILLGSAFIVTKGYVDPAVGEAYSRARALCRELHDTSGLVPGLVGLWLFYFIRAEHDAGRAIAEEMFSLAAKTQLSSDLLCGDYVLGQSLVGLGQFADAQRALRRASERYDAKEHHALAARYGEDPGGVSLAFEAMALFALGYPDQALQRALEAISLTETLGHGFTLAQALFCAAFVHQYRGDSQAMFDTAARALALAEERRFAYFPPVCAFVLTAARLALGGAACDIERLRAQLVDYQTGHSKLFTPYFISLLVVAEDSVGNVGRGLELIEHALSQVEATNERWHEAELHRLKGRLSLRLDSGGTSSGIEAAEACFVKALEVARRQHAKSWELRAATDLARLWQQQGKEAAAFKLLSGSYAWFTEGFDTKDLQEAKALLNRLG